MNLRNINKMRAEKGFTIVELLIVIVVIGILAAIVIVAYTGVTNNARNAKYKGDAGSIQKVAEVIYTDNGSYPDTAGEFTAGSTTTKLPSGIAVSMVTSAPTNADAITAADGATTSTYSVDDCGGAGLKIYYPVRGGSIQSVNVGNTSSGC